MANTPTPITSLITGNPKLTDYYPAVDVTDTSMAPTGTTKKYTIKSLAPVILSTFGFASYPNCTVSTTDNLTAIYFNGPGNDGINATLTNSGTLEPLVVDGYTVKQNDIVLVKNQTSSLQNGIYVAQIVGSPTTAWVLLRAPYFNQTSNIFDHGVTFVLNGVANEGTFWQVIVTEPVNVGTDPINFILFNFGTAAFKDATDNSKPDVVSVENPVVVDHVPKFYDILGSINDSGILYTDIVTKPMLGNTQNVYVAPEGNDVTGNGSILFPYATITHALSSITDNSSIKPYGIIINSGVYNEANLVLKPFVFLQGLSVPFVNVSGDITLDPTFGGVDGQLILESLSLTVTGNVDLDFSAFVGAKCAIFMNYLLLNGSSFSTFTVTGDTGNNSFLVMTDIEQFNGFASFNYSNLGTILDDCIITTNVNFTNNSSTNSSLLFMLKSNLGQVVITDSSGAGVQALASANFGFGNITLNGAATNLNIDTASFQAVPTLNGGATYTLLNIAEGLNADFIPVNYTPTGTHNDVKGHLQGIDNKFGSLETIVWNQTSTNTNMEPDNGYAVEAPGAINLTLPVTCPFGHVIAFCNVSGFQVNILQNAGQQIIFGSVTTTPGTSGSLVSNVRGDAMRILCTNANTTFLVLSPMGNIDYI